MTRAACVVCAPNAYKGTLTAAGAASAMARGVRDTGAVACLAPVADGGDGTLDVLLAARGARASVRRHRVTGPLGAPVLARLGWLSRRFAVVEMAEAAGLRRTAGRLDAMGATSRGAGELIATALEAGARRILVGVGGSASSDGGAGLLQALGVRLLDAAGRDIAPGAAGLATIRRVEPGGIMRWARRRVRIDVAVDVDNPLHGPAGAAVVFGPQKGADPDQVRRLDQALARFASVVEADLGQGALAGLPGAGAAGGCGFALALLGARLAPGAALVCDMVGLDRELRRADAVLTGEGRLDRQTAAGKGPAEVARRARRGRLPCAAIAGSVAGEPEGMFDLVLSLEAIGQGLDPMRHGRRLLRQAAARATAALLGPQ